jgi:UbiD family decarboxylase
MSEMLGYNDLRGFILQAERLGAVRHVIGADPRLEAGAVTELAAGLPECPALLFDALKGYKRGFRIFTNATTNVQRAALALGLDPSLRPLEALAAWMKLRASLTPQQPVEVSRAAFLENSDVGGAVDLGKFPVPHWHRKDGGPYIGSGSLVIMRDPGGGWINASIYRVQVHDRDRVTIQFDHLGRHGAIIAKKYWDKGQPCPVAVVNGEDPALFIAGFEYLPEEYSEYAFAGAIKQRPIEVYNGPVTGLPLPAQAEIILEGALLPFPQTSLPEGPFGEFTGYYASEARPAPVMEVTAVHYRDDPILLGSPPMKPPRFHFGLPFRAASIWSNLETAGVTDVVGAWQHVSQLMTVIALRQRYDGHAKRAALIAAANSYMGRVVVVVDEDVDPSNLADVMWAITTRAEPSESVDIVREAWSSALDPRISPEARARGVTSHSKMIINACLPFSWKSQFPATSALSVAELTAVDEKWGMLLRGHSISAKDLTVKGDPSD